MFLLSNIQDRNYWEDFSDIEGVIFDITDKVLKNRKNKDWFLIKEGSIACVIMSTRKVSTFYRVKEIIEQAVNNAGDEAEKELRYLLVGEVVAKSDDREDVTRLLNKHSVSHPNLPKNKIGVAFKIADIGNGLDEIIIKTAEGSSCKLGEL